MTTIVIVEKNGTLKEVKAKDVTRDTLYTKCGFRKSNGFEMRTTWNVEIDEKYKIELWSRDDGKANTENKYDFPPPVDNDLYFGNCCVIRICPETDDIIDFKINEWMKIYENLFGGFEDLVDEEASEDELDAVPVDMKTKSGYLKDGFVVGTDSDSENSGHDNNGKGGNASGGSDGSEDEEYAPNDDTDNTVDTDDTDETDKNDESGSELEQEPYYYSDDEV